MVDIEDLWDTNKLSPRMREKMDSYARVLESGGADKGVGLGSPDTRQNAPGAMPMVEQGDSVQPYGTGG